MNDIFRTAAVNGSSHRIPPYEWVTNERTRLIRRETKNNKHRKPNDPCDVYNNDNTCYANCLIIGSL